MTSSLVPEVSERCGDQRSPGSKITCELAHGHDPSEPGVREHWGRDAAGHEHRWTHEG